MPTAPVPTIRASQGRKWLYTYFITKKRSITGKNETNLLGWTGWPVFRSQYPKGFLLGMTKYTGKKDVVMVLEGTIMENTHGYKPLSWDLIKLLSQGPPDFAGAEKLIHQGADVNDQGEDKEENVLSRIMFDYTPPKQEKCDNCDEDDCDICEHNPNASNGENILRIIKFFLDHGFDVNHNEGDYGRRCFESLAFVYDRSMIEATKLLFSAYGKNPIKWIEDEESPVMGFVRECDYLDVAHSKHSLANIYEAVCQIFYAVEEGCPYMGVDSFEAAIGKKIIKVMAETEKEDVFFSMDDPQHAEHKFFTYPLLFMYEDGYLCYTSYTTCWVDTYIPDEAMVDVTDYFSPIINHQIKDITFSNKLITTLHFDNNMKLNIAVYDNNKSRYLYFQ